MGPADPHSQRVKLRLSLRIQNSKAKTKTKDATEANTKPPKKARLRKKRMVLTQELRTLRQKSTNTLREKNEDTTALTAFDDMIMQGINVIGNRQCVRDITLTLCCRRTQNQHEWQHWFDILIAYRIQMIQTRVKGLKAPLDYAAVDGGYLLLFQNQQIC